VTPTTQCSDDQAADEGWNPGLHDADSFWHTDPGAFVAAELDGEVIGGGSIASYDGRFGFMGFFIVRPRFRGRGYGSVIWQARKRLLLDRLSADATIGMDGVFEMQDWYEKRGFEFAYRQIRFVATGAVAHPAASVVPLARVPFDELLGYDSTCFPAPRERFLRTWLAQSDSLALASVKDGALMGYGVVRRCREGAKVGPLFANDAATAAELYDALAGYAAGGSVYLDVPENNPAAMAFVAGRDMQQVFGVARMYLGQAPNVRADRIFGNTTFELG
jgi:ribosomal protein S18 acetylase RimI-like enzyme